MNAMPDLEIEVQRRHVTDDAILLEVMIRGTHLGKWRGLPATGRRVEFPLCGVYTFDSENRLAGEKIYYDRRKPSCDNSAFFMSRKAYWVSLLHSGDTSGHHGTGAGEENTEEMRFRRRLSIMSSP